MSARTIAVALALAAALANAAAPANAATAWVPARTASSTGDSGDTPKVAIGPTGEVLATWISLATNPFEVHAAVHAPGGEWAAAPIPDGVGGGHTSGIDALGNAWVVWSRVHGPSDQRLYVSMRPPGGSFGPATPLGSDVQAYAPAIGFDAQGGVLVAWANGDSTGSVARAAYRPPGGSFEMPDTISAAGLIHPEDVAFGPHGEAAVAWHRGGATDHLELAFRPAGGTFGEPETIASAAGDVAEVRLAFDGDGNLLAMSRRDDGGLIRPGAAFRPAGGAFGPTEPLQATFDKNSFHPQVGVDAAGNFTVAWMEGFELYRAVRPRAASFGEPLALTVGDLQTYDARLAVLPDGSALIIFVDANTGVTRATYRPPAGEFGAPAVIDESPSIQSQKELAIDANGNAAAVYLHQTGTLKAVRVAGFDGAPPVLAGLSIPEMGAATTPLAFGVAPLDVWSPVTTVWEFGDGTSASGEQVSHTFAAAGAATVKVTATDAIGNAATASQALTVTPAPPTVDGDVVAPVLSALRLTPGRFRAAARGPSLAARTGSQLSFTLTEAASVRFNVRRATRGRRVGSRCRRATRRLRGRRACTRWVSIKGRFIVSAQAGTTTRTFRGRVGGRRLARGRHRLAGRAIDAADNASKTARTPFRIVRR